LALDDDSGPLLQPTFCIAEGWGFEIRLPGGNDDLERDYKIIEKFLRKSQAPLVSIYCFLTILLLLLLMGGLGGVKKTF